MAALSVLNISELFGLILLQLPIEDILAVKSVAKSWNDLVNESVRLRQATFQVPKGHIIHPIRKNLSERSWTILSLEDLPTLRKKPSEVIPLFAFRAIEEKSGQAVPWSYQVNST